MMSTRHPIVVGIDGGPASVAALEVAIEEAQLRETQVVAITCWPARDRRDDAGPLIFGTAQAASELLEHVIREARIHESHEVIIVREVSQSLPGPTLVRASAEASLLVLGSTTRGTAAHRHGHHVINHCLRFAESPVLIVPWTRAGFNDVDIEIDLNQAHSAR
jgi:nucleotide-binding universal stress UspA family protein